MAWQVRRSIPQSDHGTGAGDNSNVTLLRPEFFAAHAVRALSGLSLEGEERDILREIRKGNREANRGHSREVCNGTPEVQGKVGPSIECQSTTDSSVSGTESTC